MTDTQMIYEIINNASFWTVLALLILFLIILIFRFDKIYKALKGINGNSHLQTAINNTKIMKEDENLPLILKKLDKILGSHLQYVSTSELTAVQFGRELGEIQDLLRQVNEKIIRIDELLRK